MVTKFVDQQLHKFRVTQETQDEIKDFKSQRNANDSQDQPIPNVPGVLRNPSVMDLSQKNTKLLPSNSHQPPMVNLLDSPTTLTHGKTIIKKKRNNLFSLIINSTNRNNKILVEAMEKISVM
jgi:hypothetical protein